MNQYDFNGYGSDTFLTEIAEQVRRDRSRKVDRVLLIAACVLIGAAAAWGAWMMFVQEPATATPEDIAAGKFGKGDWVELNGTLFSHNLGNLEFSVKTATRGVRSSTTETSVYLYQPVLCADDVILTRAESLQTQFRELQAFPVDEIADAASGRGLEAFQKTDAFTAAWNSIGSPTCFVLVEEFQSSVTDSFPETGYLTFPQHFDGAWKDDLKVAAWREDSKKILEAWKEKQEMGALLLPLNRDGVNDWLPGFKLFAEPDSEMRKMEDEYQAYGEMLDLVERTPVETAIKTDIEPPEPPSGIEYLRLSHVRRLVKIWESLVDRYNVEVVRRNEHVYAENRKQFSAFVAQAQGIVDGLTTARRDGYSVTGLLAVPRAEVVSKYRTDITPGISPTLVLHAGERPSPKWPIAMAVVGLVLLALFVRRQWMERYG